MIPKKICIFIASIVLLRAEAGAQAIATTPTRSDQAILQELEQMRARIQELEAELQQRQNVATPPDPQPAPASEAGPTRRIARCDKKGLTARAGATKSPPPRRTVSLELAERFH